MTNTELIKKALTEKLTPYEEACLMALYVRVKIKLPKGVKFA